MFQQVKVPDVEVLGCHGYTWSAIVRPVGHTAKFSKTALDVAYCGEMYMQRLWWTFLLSACQLHTPSKLETFVALCCDKTAHLSGFLLYPAQGAPM